MKFKMNTVSSVCPNIRQHFKHICKIVEREY